MCDYITGIPAKNKRVASRKQPGKHKAYTDTLIRHSTRRFLFIHFHMHVFYVTHILCVPKQA